MWNNFIVLLESFSVFFFEILIFDPKSPFSKRCSRLIVKIFANFQNGLNFRILAGFLSCFLRGTTLLCF